MLENSDIWRDSIFMDKIQLFTDGSVDVNSKIGYGACIWIMNSDLSLEELKKRVKVKRFENTTSTKLELQMLIWALKEVSSQGKQVLVYTDSQNIVRLPERRTRLEQNDYRSKNNRRLNNEELYREFFRIIDLIECEFVKVWGHQPSKNKDDIHRIFTFVDRASRKALRDETGI